MIHLFGASNLISWPWAADRLHSDETPVENGLQNPAPNFLLAMRLGSWGDQQGCYWGVDTEIYDH